MRISPILSRSPLTRFIAFMTVLLISSVSYADDAIPTDLSASEISDFIGTWTLSLDFNGNTMKFNLKIVDIDGKAGATFDSERQPEPVTVEEMSLSEDGALQLTYELQLGEQSIPLLVSAHLTEEGLEGNIDGGNGAFTAPFTAVEAIDDVEIREQRRRSRAVAKTSATLRFGQDKVKITFSALKTSSKDYQTFEALIEGSVFEYVGGRAAKMLTDFDLIFGDTTIVQGNAYVTYPGVYSLWLKKNSDGWSLVFNEEADVWGTMFNPETVKYEIPLKESESEEAAEAFKISLENIDDSGGRLTVHWDNKTYSADFTKGGKRSQPESD